MCVTVTVCGVPNSSYIHIYLCNGIIIIMHAITMYIYTYIPVGKELSSSSMTVEIHFHIESLRQTGPTLQYCQDQVIHTWKETYPVKTFTSVCTHINYIKARKSL